MHLCSISACVTCLWEFTRLALQQMFERGLCRCDPDFDIEGRARGQVLHVSAATTEALRRAMQHSRESLRVLAKRHVINQKTGTLVSDCRLD